MTFGRIEIELVLSEKPVRKQSRVKGKPIEYLWVECRNLKEGCEHHEVILKLFGPNRMEAESLLSKNLVLHVSGYIAIDEDIDLSYGPPQFYTIYAYTDSIYEPVSLPDELIERILKDG